uniref:Uncharacterized protein n=1 Tax=Oryza glumipatula TaxID=40148 RepID=A0A0E0BS12_9ORYZ
MISSTSKLTHSVYTCIHGCTNPVCKPGASNEFGPISTFLAFLPRNHKIPSSAMLLPSIYMCVFLHSSLHNSELYILSRVSCPVVSLAYSAKQAEEERWQTATTSHQPLPWKNRPMLKTSMEELHPRSL